MSVRGIFHFIWRKTVAVFADYPKVFTGLPDNLRASSAELWNVRSLCGMALMLALGVIVDQFSFYVGPIKIGVGSIISAMLGCFYGPVAGGFAAGVGDLVKYLVRADRSVFLWIYPQRDAWRYVLRPVSVQGKSNAAAGGFRQTADQHCGQRSFGHIMVFHAVWQGL